MKTTPTTPNPKTPLAVSVRRHCAEPGCGDWAIDGSSYCAQHR